MKTASRDPLLPTVASELKFGLNNIRSVETEASLVREFAKGSRNRLCPDPSATGAHSVFRRDPMSGAVSHYETFAPQYNPYDPKAWFSVKRFDGTANWHEHYNKITSLDIPTPHVHDPFTPGGIRVPQGWEKPK